MQNVLPRSGARAYTVSDDASADQRYCMYKMTTLLCWNRDPAEHDTDLPTFYEIKAEDLPPFGKNWEDFYARKI